jgi:hypothetical protein
VTFRNGDRVRAIAVPDVVPTGVVQVGSTGTVIGGLLPDDGWYADRYNVRWDDGRELPRHARCLAPIDDRPELTTWEAVRASCGWMPGTVRA